MPRGGQGHGRDPQASLPLRPRTQVHQGAARHRLWLKSQNPNLNPHPNPTQGGPRDRLAEEHREGRVAASGAKQRSHKLTWAPSITVTLNPNQVPSAGRKNTENKLNAKAPPRGHLMLLSSDAAAARGPTRPSLRRPRANALVPTAAEL